MARLGTALLWLHLAVGAGWLAVNLGDLPHYGDTRGDVDTATTAPGYVMLAREGGTDNRRGLAYAPFLALVHGLLGGDLEQGFDPEIPRELPEHAVDCHAPGWVAGVQLAQLALFAAALWAAGRVLLPALVPRAGPRALLLASVFVDPILAHMQLALLPGGPATSACLLFLCGWVAAVRDGRRGGFALLALAAALAAALRPEKALVLLGTALLALAVAFLRRRVEPGRLRRAALAAGLCLAVTAAHGAARSALDEGESADNWTIGELVVHSRLVFPHAEALRPELPPPWRARFTPRLAAHYDSDLVKLREAVEYATDGDPAQRAEFTRVLARLALARFGARTALDVAGDTLRNLAPTPVFLVMLAAWWQAGADPAETILRGKEALWLWSMLSYHEPLWSRAALGTAALVLLVGGATALARLARRRRLLPAPERALSSSWTAPLALLLVNAAAFAATQDLFELRYVLPEHLALVLAAQGALLPRAALSAPRAAAGPAPGRGPGARDAPAGSPSPGRGS